MRPSARHPLFAIAFAALAAQAPAGCAHVPPPTASPPPGAAFLPLEDLSGKAAGGDRLSEVVFTALAASHRCRLVEPGEVQSAMDEARIRSSGVLTRDQTRQLAERLRVRWILTGSALEYGSVRTPDGEVPAVGIALRLIDGPNGAIAWADQRYRTGEDHETIFGWGRITSLDRLAQETAAELAAALRFPGPADTSRVWKGVR